MGGDAFPDTCRLTEDEYQRICENIRTVIDETGVRGIHIGFPVEVKDKAELCQNMGKGAPYGDVDVIIGADNEAEKLELIKALNTTLGIPGEHPIKNDKEYSFLTKERYQVDVKFCPTQRFDFLLAFQGNNDFGALLGHLLTHFNLKWSDEGLILRLKMENVSKIGTVKEGFVLTDNIRKVCDFVGIPHFCLDGSTRMASQDIFNILTTCKLYFNNNSYGQKYKIRERRKRRPVVNAFFDALEKNEDCDTENKNDEKFQDDPVYTLLKHYRDKIVSYDEYIEQISDCFGKKEEVKSRYTLMRDQSNTVSEADAKFNYYVLRNWYPQLDQVKAGKVLGRLKNSMSGAGSNDFQKWIIETDIEEIRRVTDEVLKHFEP